MKPILWVLVSVLSGWGANAVLAKDLSPREIYESASPAVVMVMGHPARGDKGSGGTGSIIRADGYVLTNAHVVIDEQSGKPYTRLSVYLKPVRVTGDSKSDLSRMARATLVAYSQPLDLALLKLDGISGALPVVRLDEADQARIGDRVVAIGHPEQGGLWTLTTGVISAEVDNFNGVNGKHVYQTETGLNRGNSGGPLLDGEGRMVGVNTAIARVASDGLPITSISFSLKASVAKRWLTDQGVGGGASASAARPSPQTKAGAEVPLAPSAPAQAKPIPPGNPGVPPPAPAKPVTAEPVTPRPYNLDQLVSDRAKAEADLEGMITEMRGRMKGR